MSDVDVYEWRDSSDWPSWQESGERPTTHTVRLDGTDFAVDTAKYRHRSLPSLRDTLATSAQADDSMYSSDAAWNRYAYSWHHGAGATVHDFGPDADQFRFLRCSGIDPWTPHELRLARTIKPDTNKTIRGYDCLYAPNGYFYAVDLVGQHVYSGIAGTPGNWTQDPYTSLAGNPLCLETFGYKLYCGTTTKVNVIDLGSGSAWSAFTTTGYSWAMLRYAAGRFFGFSTAGGMYEFDSAGTITLVFSPIQSSSVPFYWNCCFSLGSRIYAGGTDQQTSHLWSFETDSTGALFRGAQALDLPPGEILRCAASGAGFALIGTSRGIRFVRPVGDGTLEFGPLIGIVGDNYAEFYEVVIDGRWAWARTTDPFTGEPCLLRIDLSTFTSPLAPAWSWDAAARGGSTWTVAGYNGQRMLAVRGASGGVDGAGHQVLSFGQFGSSYYPVTTSRKGKLTYGGYTGTYPYDEYGIIESAPVFFGTVESKRLHSLTAVADRLVNKQTLGGYVLDQSSRAINEGEVDAPDHDVRGVVIDLYAEEVDSASVFVELAAPDGNDTPVLRNWRIRGFPAVPPVEEWIVPLLLHEKVTQGGGSGTTVSQNPQTLLARLRELWVSKEAVEYVDGGVTTRVRIEDFEITAPPSWTTRGDGFQMAVLVRLLSV